MTQEHDYGVQVVRIGYATRTLHVKATSAAEAREKALAIAPNEVFSEHDSEYKAESVIPADWGNLEGHDYKDHECWLSLSGPDADALLKRLRPWLRALDWPNGFKVLKRFGEYYQEDARTVPARSLGRKDSKHK